ncbi:UNVERIFIED_CONTAM: hypothetical protein RMT77_010138 [Armadillidium vulgare]|nr:Ribonuclease kappa [Armadillidium vulgare]
MPICGYKISLFGSVVSLWGLIQLLIMGVLFYAETPAFLEDLPMEGPYENNGQYMADVHRGFKTNAFNCLIAACLFIITLGISAWQFYLNQKTTYQV